MLDNELAKAEELIGQLTAAEQDDPAGSGQLQRSFIQAFERMCAKARHAWALALFADLGDPVIRRYVNFHIRVITDCCRRLENVPDADWAPALKNELTGLLAHLLAYYPAYVDKALPAPALYRKQVTGKTAGQAGQLLAGLDQLAINGELKSAVTDYLKPLYGAGNPAELSFDELEYLPFFLKELLPVLEEKEDPGRRLAEKLVYLNFNRLAFFHWFTEEQLRLMPDGAAGEKKAYLRRLSGAVRQGAVQEAQVCCRKWPSLKTMLSDWIAEETDQPVPCAAVASFPESVPQQARVPLQFSVAHLALLLKLFYEEGHFGAVQLTELFKFISGNFRTRRQPVPSPGGLSKAYYSVSQVTAAVVKDMLQKMISRISRDFFPLTVAAGLLLGAR